MRRASSETIYDELKEQIIFLHLRPGEEISQERISERYDVSRSPVRDALLRLRAEGLVVMRPQRGCWVSRIDISQIDDECFYRLALERSALSRCRDGMKSSDLARLGYAIALQKEAAAASDAEAFYNADDDMHSVFFEIGGLMRIWRLIERETGNIRRLRMLAAGGNGSMESCIAEHEALLDALRRRDFTAAEGIETEHLSSLRNAAGAAAEANPGYFENSTAVL